MRAERASMEERMQTNRKQEMPQVKIRRMETADLPQAARLEQECFSVPWSMNLLSEGLKGPWDVFFVAEQGGCVCGYAMLRLLAGEGEIQRIAVEPGRQGQGIGKKLVERMVSFSRENGVKAVTLEVRESNQAALCLYESYGFKREGLRRGYYQNPAEDAVIMWRREI